MYTETMGRHILPYIGDVKLTDLTSRKIEQWIETLKMQEVPFTMDGKMKEGTIRNTLSVLSGCLRDAQKRGMIRENPCAEVAEVITGRNVMRKKNGSRRNRYRRCRQNSANTMQKMDIP